MQSIRAAMRATNAKNPLSWAAHRAGVRAEAFWLKARLMLSALKDREAAANREKKAKKLPSQWWRGK
jgi:hypothetical protein